MKEVKVKKVDPTGESDLQVENCDIEASGKNIVALTLTLNKKYLEAASVFTDKSFPGIQVTSNTKDTCYFLFESLKGWNVFLWSVGKYTVYICLINYKQ